jgi:hypothetical protein
VSGSASLRPDYSHRRSGQGDRFAGRRRQGAPADHPAYDDSFEDIESLRRDLKLLPHPPEPDARPAPDEPGLVMARHLAGDDKSDEALERLLDDLDDLNEPAPEPATPRRNALPIAPFLTSRFIVNPFYRAAAAYQWGQNFLNCRDPLRPGAVYSERF